MRGSVTAAGTRVDVAGLLWTLARTDFKTRYHGTFGGFLWALLKPALMFVVLMSVFSFIFATSPNYRLNLIVGLFLWDFFAEATKTGLTSLHAKGYLLAKTRFPSWILVVASASNALLTLAVFLAIFLAYLAFAGRAPGAAAAALTLFYLVLFFAITVGISLAGSVLFLRYRDLNQVWDVAVQAGFFVAPIIYPLEILPERFHFWLYLWPPTPVIQFCRAVLVDGVLPTARANLLLAAMAAVILAVGVLVFSSQVADAAERL
ncbi:MAG TPA: ABC transporter permease [Vicinamibacterales bacterium]|nr:ABC transporter permease [Acidobacteriota bacterium]HOC18494.1 ABC transporter permease [Vicinamibacterales bacterium]